MYKAIILTVDETAVWNYGSKEDFAHLYKRVCEAGAPTDCLLGRDYSAEPLYDLEWHTPEDFEEQEEEDYANAVERKTVRP